METYQSDEYLYHYGVRGMKWGIRKAQNVVAGIRARKKQQPDGRVGPEVNKTLASKQVRKMSSKKANKLSAEREKEWRKVYNNRSRMTNEELSSALKRLNLENQFAQQVKTAQELTAPTPKNNKTKELMQQLGGSAVVVSKVAPVVIDSMPGASPQLKEASKKLKTVNKLLSVTGVGQKKKKGD